MSSETVNRKVQRKRRKRRRSRSRAWIAVLAVVLVAAAGAGAWIYFRGLPPKAELYLALRQWTGQWRAGDGSALEEGLRFGAPRADAAFAPRLLPCSRSASLRSKKASRAALFALDAAKGFTGMVRASLDSWL